MNGMVYLANTKLTAASVGGVLSFILAEITTGQAALAGILALASAGLAAWLASRPALIQARVAVAGVQETQEEKRQRRADQLHEEEVKFLQERIVFHSQAGVLARTSKHNVLEYAQDLTSHVYKLRLLMTECGPECAAKIPEFRFKSYDELCGEEDRALALLALPPDVHASITPDRSGEVRRDG